MKSVSVYYFCPVMERIVTHDGMASIMIIINWIKMLWVTGRGGQCTKIFSRGNRNGNWKRIRELYRDILFERGL